MASALWREPKPRAESDYRACQRTKRIKSLLGIVMLQTRRLIVVSDPVWTVILNGRFSTQISSSVY